MVDSSAECWSLDDVMAALEVATLDNLVAEFEAIADDDVVLQDVDDTGFEILVDFISERIEYPTTVADIVENIHSSLRLVRETYEAQDADEA